MGTNQPQHKSLKKKKEKERWYSQAGSFRNLHCTDFCQGHRKRRTNLKGNKCKGEARLGSNGVGPPTRTPIQTDGSGIEQTTSEEALENRGQSEGGLIDVRTQNTGCILVLLINHHIVFHANSCKPTFAPPCIVNVATESSVLPAILPNL